MPTKAQLLTYVLDRLGTGDNPAPEDVAKVESIVAETLADLSRRKIISYVPSADYLEEGSLEWLGRIMENVIAVAFGAREDGEARRYAEAMLLSQQAPDTFFPVKVAYF